MISKLAWVLGILNLVFFLTVLAGILILAGGLTSNGKPSPINLTEGLELAGLITLATGLIGLVLTTGASILLFQFLRKSPKISTGEQKDGLV